MSYFNSITVKRIKKEISINREVIFVNDFKVLKLFYEMIIILYKKHLEKVSLNIKQILTKKYQLYDFHFK